jgi:L-alanine-DL-glutamate epimerase-like enolase superfamily enzyme
MELLAEPLLPVVNGHRPIPLGPGLGITIDEDKLMGLVGEPQAYGPQFDPDDGSVVDW